MEKSRTKNSIINISSGFISQILTTILKFITQTIFIKFLGSEYLGLNGLFTKNINKFQLIYETDNYLFSHAGVYKEWMELCSFNLDNLKWNKIIICTDADVDGFQIRTLILTMLFRLTPTLIEEGYVYIAETPLYEITYKGRGEEQTFFAFDDKEKAKILKGKDSSKITIQRSKGLGENDADMMWETTMNPENRRLIRVTTEDAKVMSDNFELYLGTNIGMRKKYIEENGHLYLDDLDLD